MVVVVAVVRGLRCCDGVVVVVGHPALVVVVVWWLLWLLMPPRPLLLLSLNRMPFRGAGPPRYIAAKNNSKNSRLKVFALAF